jgi:hypothetical protein
MNTNLHIVNCKKRNKKRNLRGKKKKETRMRVGVRVEARVGWG